MSEIVTHNKAKPKTKVAIVGFADTKEKTPFLDEEFEFWGLNELYVELPDKPWTRWFQIHDRGEYLQDFSDRDFAHLKALQNMKIPVYMVRKYEDIPASEPYPLDDICKQFRIDRPIFDKRYFASSIAYMVALAVYEWETKGNFKEMHLYGVNLAQDSEYAYERPNLEFWLGIAHHSGMRIYIPRESDVMKFSHLYGYEKAPYAEAKVKSEIDEMMRRVNMYSAQELEARDAKNQCIGAHQKLVYMYRALR